MALSKQVTNQKDRVSGPDLGLEQGDFVRNTWALVLSYSVIIVLVVAVAFGLAGCETTLRIGPK